MEPHPGLATCNLPVSEHDVIEREVRCWWHCFLSCMREARHLHMRQCGEMSVQYASLATQIGTAARAEAPVRALKAISPNITKKRALKPEPVPR